MPGQEICRLCLQFSDIGGSQATQTRCRRRAYCFKEQVLCQWKDDTSTWVSFKDMKELFPIESERSMLSTTRLLKSQRLYDGLTKSYGNATGLFGRSRYLIIHTYMCVLLPYMSINHTLYMYILNIALYNVNRILLR